MDFLYLLERIRSPLLDKLMLLITTFGEETAFLVAAMVVFWCVDKRKGYYVMAVGFVGTMANQILKLLCRVPRPWVLDPDFSIVEQAREAAAGYSFPSGHSQSAVGTFGSIACCTKNKAVKWLCIVIAVLVPFSRMYLGVHTPADVLVGSGMAAALIFLMRFVWNRDNEKGMGLLIAGMLVMSLGFLWFVNGYPFPADMDEHNLASGMKNAYTMLGSLAGVALVYYAEKKYIKFETKAAWWAQILKVILGLLAVLAVKEGLRSPLEALMGDPLPARAVRYFLIVVTAGIVWPLTFRWFAGFGKRRNNI